MPKPCTENRDAESTLTVRYPFVVPDTSVTLGLGTDDPYNIVKDSIEVGHKRRECGVKNRVNFF